MKMWSGRFAGGPDEQFDRWQRSFPFDRRLLPYELAASSAYARGLHRAGALGAAELDQLLAALKAIGEGAQSNPALLEDAEVEDVHHFVEKQLVMRIGELGYKLHSGRSRNEQIATDLRLYLRHHAAQLQKLLARLSSGLVRHAEEAGDAAMPAYTHLQRAEPVLVAHWLLAYVAMFQRDAQRVAECAARAEECPLGAGAVAGSTLALDREFISRELGFKRPTANSMDATSDRDFAVEFVGALSLLGIHLSRWAEEFILFSTQEFGFVRLPEGFSTGSSAMPQKKNPDSLELIRAKAARFIGCSVSLMGNLKGLALSYNKDLQDTQEPFFQATETALECVGIAAGFMRQVEFDFGRMQRAAESSFMNAFAAATYLVKKGVPFRIAHERVGKAVQAAIKKDCRLEDLSLAELRAFSPEFSEDFYAAVSLSRVLELHDVEGGTAPHRVRKALRAAKEQLAPAQEVKLAGA